MKKISINPQALRARAAELDDLRAQHDELMRQLRTLVAGLPDIWQGEAQQAFLNKFYTQSKKISELDGTVADFIATVRRAAEAAEEADSALAAKIRARKG